MAEKDATGGSDGETIVIKKYANRRLYNTASSSYVTLDHLCQMVKDGQEFAVYDAKTGENITHQVLTQIIVEEEGKGQNLLPISFLRQLICLYGDSVQSFVPRYLEFTMDTFARNQEQIRAQMEKAFGGMFPFGEMEAMGRQNMAMFERAMRMFAPFAAAGGEDETAGDKPSETEDIATLRKKLDAMQSQLDALARKSGDKD